MKITPPCLRACRKSFLIRATPRPIRNPVTSLPLMTKNGTPASPATARAIRVLPVPGGPNIRTPFGVRAPDRLERIGGLQELDQLTQLGDGALVTAHVGERGAAPPRGSDPAHLRPAAELTPQYQSDHHQRQRPPEALHARTRR